MVSVKQVRAAIFAQLRSTRALTDLVADRIYHAEAPSGIAFPFVVFHKQAGTPTYTFGGHAWDDHVWLVKCVDRSGSSSVAEDAQAAIDTALTDAPLAITGATSLYLKRSSDAEYLETVDGVQYRHHGSLFRVVVA